MRTIAVERQKEVRSDRAKAWEGSRIRLKGRWLEAAGFKPGMRVKVNVLAPGLVQLQTEGVSYHESIY
jgi:hypothetical protein